MSHEWRYLHGGRVRRSVNAEYQCASAVCGTGPAWFDHWYGTGCQHEYEQAAKLPTCKRCAKLGPLPSEEKK